MIIKPVIQKEIGQGVTGIMYLISLCDILLSRLNTEMGCYRMTL